MNEVLLEKGGAIVHKGKVVENEPLLCLGAKVELETGFTLRSFFELLRRYPVFCGLNSFLGSFLEQYRKNPQAGPAVEGLDVLEFGKTVEMIGFPGKPRLEIYTSLNGRQGESLREIRPFPIEGLLGVPLRFSRLKHIIFGDKADIFEFETVITLFEFLEGIAWALSFQSTPPHCGLRR
jgi:hypothetical protein